VSGWIKAEKDLCQDIRVLRMANILKGNASALQGVTLVLGGLIRLWMHADSFARDDDTLDITLNEIDQLTGIDGFAQALPADWLEVLNENCVKLPAFHAHNGTDAKRKALTAKRVAHHRDRVKLNGVSNSNAHALPDQTRPDQTNNKKAAAPPVVTEPVPGLSQQAWAEWVAYRIAIRKPIKPFSVNLAQRQLAKYGAQQLEVVNHSIANSYQGLIAPKPQPFKPGAVKPASEPLTPEQQEAYRRRMESANRAASERFSTPATNVGAKTG
jgi:hypothetical protein